MPKTFQDPDAYHVLVVEDDPDHAELIRLTLNEHPSRHEILHLHDGEEAQDYLHHLISEGESAMKLIPHIILLDLKLPKITGHEVLAMLKANSALQPIPVIILTTSTSTKDLTRAYLGHANSYLIKPQDYESFTKLVELIGTYWLDWNTQQFSLAH